MISVLVIASLYFCTAQAGLVTVFGHLGIALLSAYGLIYSSRYYLFWFLLALVLFASEPRFSFEYFLWAAGLVGVSISPLWLGMSQRKREIILLFVFLLFALADYSKITFSERGSMLIWLPVWLATISSLNSTWLEPFAAIAMLFSNKKAALLAYMVYLGEKIKLSTKALLSILVVPVGFLIALIYWLSHHPKFWSNFLNKSIMPRLHIWQSVFNGFLDKPIFGHGFGTFAIDFPIYRPHANVLGARAAEHVAHGHSLPLHLMFELGLVGLALYLLLVVLIYRYARKALLPFLVISICDATMVSFNQYFLAALILVPAVIASLKVKRYPEQFANAHYRLREGPPSLANGIVSPSAHNDDSHFWLAMTLPQKLIKPACYLACILTLIFGSLSVTAHYYYDRGNFSQAIALDPYHSLYHFMRGASNLHMLAANSEADLERAVELSSHVSYFYGFLAAAHLANTQDLSKDSQDPRIKSASEAINKAIQYDGSDAYWHTLSSFIHYQNPELSKSEMELALKRNPEIETLLKDPSITASEYIGSRKSDVRISGFYRRGPKVYLPLPYIE